MRINSLRRRRVFRKPLSLVLLALLFPSFPIASQEKILRIGYFSCPPHIYAADGNSKPVGALVDYWENALSGKLNVRVEWIGPLPFSRYVAMLENGEIDVAAVLGQTDARKKFCYFSDDELYQAQSAILVLTENPLKKISGTKDILPFTIGYAQGQIISAFMQDPRITWDMITASDWIDQNFQKLLSKRVDAVYFIEGFVAQYASKQFGVADRIRIIPLPESPLPMFSAFSRKSKVAAAVFPDYNRLLTAQNKSDTYARILKKSLE